MSQDKQLIEDFFFPPRSPKRLPKRLKDSGHRSLLHLLRRDLVALYGKESFFGVAARVKHKAPVLAALGMMVGLDLLSTLSCPDDLRRAVGKRFDWFLGEFCVQDEEWKSAFLRDLRHSLAHRYSMRVRAQGMYRFSTSAEYKDWVVLEGETYVVNLWGLKDLFLQTVARYRDALTAKGGHDLRERFFERYRQDGGAIKAPPLAAVSGTP